MKYLLMLLAFTVLPLMAQEDAAPAKEDEAAKKAEEKTETKNNNPVVIIKTNLGDISVELFKDAAPKTVKNFIQLAEGKKQFTDETGEKVKKPFYDGLTFHRVVEGFMIQGGCPKGDGTGDGGYKFKDEISAKSLGLDKEKAISKDGQPNSKLRIYREEQIRGMVLEPIYKKLGISTKETFEAKKEEFMEELTALDIKSVYENIGYEYDEKLKSQHMLKGYIAMANSGPNTNGTQFFINLSDNKYLDGKHTVFGKVVEGMDIVNKIGSVEVQGSRPVEKVEIKSVRLKKD